MFFYSCWFVDTNQYYWLIIKVPILVSVLVSFLVVCNLESFFFQNFSQKYLHVRNRRPCFCFDFRQPINLIGHFSDKLRHFRAGSSRGWIEVENAQIHLHGKRKGKFQMEVCTTSCFFKGIDATHFFTISKKLFVI